jgi:hypothetical protein
MRFCFSQQKGNFAIERIAMDRNLTWNASAVTGRFDGIGSAADVTGIADLSVTEPAARIYEHGRICVAFFCILSQSLFSSVYIPSPKRPITCVSLRYVTC